MASAGTALAMILPITKTISPCAKYMVTKAATVTVRASQANSQTKQPVK